MKVPQSVQKLSFKSKGFVKRNAPTILTCVGAAGVVGTAVLTAKATTKANQLLANAEKEKGEELTVKEKFITAGPSYIPAIIMGAATITSIFGADFLNKKKQAALISAYTMLDQSYKEYKKKVGELYGEESDIAIRESIAEDKLEETKVSVAEGEELFYDDYSKRFFTSTKAKVQHAQYELNRNMVMRDYAYLNEWYELLDMEPIDPDYIRGWSVGQCMDMYWQPWLDFSQSKQVSDDGQEYTIIYMLEEPIVDFADYI